MKKHALALAKQGIPVFPVANKRPLTAHGFKDATTETEEVERYWTKHPNAGIGVPTGQASGVTVLDVDGEIGAWALGDLQVENGALPETPVALTGGGGVHYFFKHLPGVKNSAGKVAPNVDVRGDGGYVVVPPSPHPSGTPYRWERSLTECQISDAPEWLAELMKTGDRELKLPDNVTTSYAYSALVMESLAVEKAPEGKRNVTLNKAAYKLGRYVTAGVLDFEQAKEMLLNDSGLPPDEAEKTIVSGLTAWGKPPDKAKPARVESLQDAGPMSIAESFIDAHCRDKEGRLTLRRWREDWYLWTGSRYDVICKEAMARLVWQHVAGLYVETEDGAKKISMSASREMNVLKALIAQPGVFISSEVRPPVWSDGRKTSNLMVSVRNGLLSLKSEEIEPHTPDYFSTTCLPVRWDPSIGEPEEWTRFVNEAWAEEDDRRLLQEWFGYCLTSDCAQQKILLMVGPPRSGKGTIATVLGGMLGKDNVAGTSMSTLASGFGLAGLMGPLVAIIGDARIGKHTDAAMVVERLLSISGQDDMTVDRKYRAPVHTQLDCKLIIQSNELPSLPDASGVVSKRFLALQFTRSHFGAEDIGLKHRLLGELPGILKWAVDGWRSLQKRGRFHEPATSEVVRDDMMRVASPITTFVDERCELGARVAMDCGRLYEEWQVWAKKNGVDEGSSGGFGRKLKAAFPAIIRKRARLKEGKGLCYCYFGIQTATQH